MPVRQPMCSTGVCATEAQGDVNSTCRYTLTVATSDGRVYFNLPGVAVVKWDAASQAAHMEWQGGASPDEFKAANDALVQAIVDHHGSRILGDSRQIKVMQKSDQNWVNTDWFPRILAAG